MNHEVASKRVQIDALADQIAVCAARIDAALHGLLTHIRQFDALRGWSIQGSKSCAHWLSWRIGVGLVAAREKVRVAAALAALPRIDAALARGELSYAKVRAMTRVATPGNETLLLSQARGTTGAELERICADFRSVVGGRLDDEEHRYVRRRTLQDGTIQIEMRLLPDEAERVWQALCEARRALRAAGEAAAAAAEVQGKHASAEAATEVPSKHASTEAGTDPAPEIDPKTESDAALRAGFWGRLPILQDSDFAEAEANVSLEHVAIAPQASLADAAVAIAEATLAARLGAGHASGRPAAGRRTLFVHLSERRLQAEDAAHARTPAWKAELHDGTALSGDSLLRLACDSGLVVAKTDERGSVLDIGRRRRTVSVGLLRALRVRDRRCRFPGCQHAAFVDAHHIEHWAHGGETSLENLVLVCHGHHVALHEGGFRVEHADGELRFIDGDGRLIEMAPRMPRVEADADSLLRDEQEKRGIHIDWRTALPRRPFPRPDLTGCVRALARQHARGASLDT